eukprot:s237_g32.t1
MSRKHTNFSQMQRISSLGPIWKRLRLSASPYHVKLRAVKVAAWPRALHAIPATTLSDATYQSLRAGAIQGLGVDAADMNAHVHLGLLEDPLCDPQFFAICHTLRFVRDCGDPDAIVRTMVNLSYGLQSAPDNGITSTLLVRLRTLSWHITMQGTCVDQFGEFCLLEVSFQELKFRAEWAWQQVIAQQVSHRPGFRGLEYVDAKSTRKWLDSLEPSDRLLMHKTLNGTHITQDCKVHCQDGGTDLCPYCDCVDSRFHRFWGCEHFDHQRAQVPPDVLALIASCPDTLTGYAWNVRPHTLLTWFQALARIPCPDDHFLCPDVEVAHIFTDGSCFNQTLENGRLAAYAVVLASVQDDAAAHVIESGPLPGLLQSAYRAEVYAILRALRSLRRYEGSIFLWCDCHSVVVKFRRILRGVEPKPNSSHADLWRQIFWLVHDRDASQIFITKVLAHTTLSNAANPLEAWCWTHNHFADQAAGRAQFHRPAGFLELYAQHLHVLQATHVLSAYVHEVQLRISWEVVHDADTSDGVLRDDLCVIPSVAPGIWSALGAFRVPEAATRWYGDEMVRSILSWYWDRTSGSHSPVWVSQFQLFADWILSGEQGPTNLKGWKLGRLTPHADLLSISFKVRVRWFCKVLKESLRHHGCGFHHSFCRPQSHAIAMHTGCLAVVWNPEHLAVIDEWILRYVPGGIRRTGHLRAPPLAGRRHAIRDADFSSVSWETTWVDGGECLVMFDDVCLPWAMNFASIFGWDFLGSSHLGSHFAWVL